MSSPNASLNQMEMSVQISNDSTNVLHKNAKSHWFGRDFIIICTKRLVSSTKNRLDNMSRKSKGLALFYIVLLIGQIVLLGLALLMKKNLTPSQLQAWIWSVVGYAIFSLITGICVGIKCSDDHHMVQRTARDALNPHLIPQKKA